METKAKILEFSDHHNEITKIEMQLPDLPCMEVHVEIAFTMFNNMMENIDESDANVLREKIKTVKNKGIKIQGDWETVINPKELSRIFVNTYWQDIARLLREQHADGNCPDVMIMDGIHLDLPQVDCVNEHMEEAGQKLSESLGYIGDSELRLNEMISKGEKMGVPAPEGWRFKDFKERMSIFIKQFWKNFEQEMHRTHPEEKQNGAPKTLDGHTLH